MYINILVLVVGNDKTRDSPREQTTVCISTFFFQNLY